MNNLDEVVHVVDKEMNVLFANEAVENLSRGKLKRKDIIGKNLYDAFPFLMEKGVDKEYEKVFSTGKPFRSEEWTNYHGKKNFYCYKETTYKK